MNIYTIALAIKILLAISIAADLAAVLKRSLMMLQLNSYRNERFTRWFNQSGESTTPWRLAVCIALFLTLVHHLPGVFTQAAAAIIVICNFVSLIRRRYKKPLVFTPRAKRLYAVMLGLALIIPAIAGLITGNLATACKIGLAEIVLSPLFTLTANILLRPVEKSINRRYYNEAASILRSMPDLKVIGITGSYGKTSTKHYLHHILSQEFETLMTPGSYNTTMGVIRTIREMMRPYTQIFIAEMGAKQPGDIKEICDLVNPEIGIITAVGEQHLETFGSVENVCRTKFELADSLPADGLAVINDGFTAARERNVDNVKCQRYYAGNDKITEEKANYKVSEVTYSPDGTHFTVDGPEGYRKEFKTPLMGECNIANLLGAIAVSRHLGVPEQKIAYALSTMPQVEHRLSTKRTTGGLTIIDDAFNSNPQGSSMALDVLAMLDIPGRRFIITPGMIELGSRQYEANKEFGAKISDCADVAIIVGQYNREAILEGIGDRMTEENVICAPDFATAQRIMTSMAERGDAVLYENDLPDTFK